MVIAVVVATFLNPAVAFSQKAKFLYEEYNLNFVGQSKSWGKVTEVIKSSEFKYAAAAIATYYGTDPQTAEKWIGNAQSLVPQGQVNEGEEHKGAFHAPDGYTTCNMYYSMQTSYADNSDTTFNLNLKRTCQRPPQDEDDVGYYIVTPSKVGDPTSVSANIGVLYVLADPPEVERLTKAGICKQHNTCAAVCTNANCSKEVLNCDPNDKRVDRWLAHHWEACNHYY
jgi:hypothetical protein